MSILDFHNFHPGLSIDCVIFGFHSGELKVLLLKMKGFDKWALPGGFVRKEEDIDKAADEVLKLRTGLENIYLQQFHAFGKIQRSNHEYAPGEVDQRMISSEVVEWLSQRFVTIGYYALVEYSKVQEPVADDLSETCEWCAIDDLPELILDHREIMERARLTIREHINSRPIGLNLLPRQFTMPELQLLYETLLDSKLDRRNFQRKMLSMNILLRKEKKRSGGAHRAPWLYEFDVPAYEAAMQNGSKWGW